MSGLIVFSSPFHQNSIFGPPPKRRLNFLYPFPIMEFRVVMRLTLVRILCFTVLLYCLPMVAFSQPYGSNEFKAKFTKADALIYEGKYNQAMPLVMDLISTDSSNANLNYLLGVCYLFTKNYPKAIHYLDKAVRDVSISHQEANAKERKAPGMAYYYLGKAFHFTNNFDQAISNLYNYRSFVDMNDYNTYLEVKRQIEYAENGRELIEKPIDLNIKNLGPTINTQYPEFAPAISADGQTLIFTSRREGSTGGKLDQNGQYYEDIYVSKRDGEGWSKPQSIGRTINTDGHEASIGLSPDGQTLFIYKDDNGDGNIYYSNLINNEWSIPRKVSGGVNTKAWETHATVSDKGDMIIFTSNREGGQGARDLWYAQMMPNGQWSQAQNLGAVINTQYDEDAPALSADGKTLIFSSKGHNSMGGFDIFRSELIDGVWSLPENLGYPLNTAEDDIFFVTTPDGRYAYYSSRRDGGFGETDLWLVKMEVTNPALLAVFKGIVVVPANEYVNLKVKIKVVDQNTRKTIGEYRPNAVNGNYVLILDPGTSYEVTYSAEGYRPVTKTVMADDQSSYKEISQVIQLEPVVFGDDILAEQRRRDQLLREREESERKLAEEASRLQAAFEQAQSLATEQEKEEARKAQEQALRAQAEEMAMKEAAEAEEALRRSQEAAAEAERARMTAELEAQQKANEAKAAETAQATAPPSDNDALARKKALIEELRKKQAALAAQQANPEPVAETKPEEVSQEPVAESHNSRGEEQAEIATDSQAKPQEVEKIEEPAKTEEAVAHSEKQPEPQSTQAVHGTAPENEENKSVEKSSEELAIEEKRQRLQQQIEMLKARQRGASEELQAVAEEEAKRKAEAEAKAREVTEAKARAAEIEKARLQKEKEAQAEAAALAKVEKEAQDLARLEEEAHKKAEAKAKAEEEAKRKAEEAARKKAEAEEAARAEAERVAKALEEQRLKAEEVARQKALAKVEAEAKRKEQEEARKQAEAERQEMIRQEKEIARQKAEVAKAEAEAEAIERRNKAIEAGTLAELRKLNQQLANENKDLKKQLADINAKLDLIISILSKDKMYRDDMLSADDIKELKKGKLVLKNIFFDYNMATLRPESKKELNKLLGFMKENVDVAIIIGGHTDSKGNDDYNMRLSQERAEAVKDYLTSNGIQNNRLTARGFGETKPVARNENPDGSDNPAGRQLNRRIEISIVGGTDRDVEVQKINVPNDLKIKN